MCSHRPARTCHVYTTTLLTLWELLPRSVIKFLSCNPPPQKQTQFTQSTLVMMRQQTTPTKNQKTLNRLQRIQTTHTGQGWVLMFLVLSLSFLVSIIQLTRLWDRDLSVESTRGQTTSSTQVNTRWTLLVSLASVLYRLTCALFLSTVFFVFMVSMLMAVTASMVGSRMANIIDEYIEENYP